MQRSPKHIQNLCILGLKFFTNTCRLIYATQLNRTLVRSTKNILEHLVTAESDTKHDLWFANETIDGSSLNLVDLARNNAQLFMPISLEMPKNSKTWPSWRLFSLRLDKQKKKLCLKPKERARCKRRRAKWTPCLEKWTSMKPLSGFTV